MGMIIYAIESANGGEGAYVGFYSSQSKADRHCKLLKEYAKTHPFNNDDYDGDVEEWERNIPVPVTDTYACSWYFWKVVEIKVDTEE